MKYNSSTGDWEIALNLTGAGDNGGAQRFKVTSAANWNGTVWGDAGGSLLCSNQSLIPSLWRDFLLICSRIFCPSFHCHRYSC